MAAISWCGWAGRSSCRYRSARSRSSRRCCRLPAWRPDEGDEHGPGSNAGAPRVAKDEAMRLDQAARSIFLKEFVEALLLSLRDFFKPKATLNYPFEKVPLSPRFPGEHVLLR